MITVSVIAEYNMRMEGLTLEHTRRATDATATVERAYATDPAHPILFVWMETDDLQILEAAMDEDESVTNVQCLSTMDGRRLYRLQLTGETEVVLYLAWVGLGGEGLEAWFEDGRWHPRVRFQDRDALAEYEEFVNEAGLDFELQRLYDGSEVFVLDIGDGLTEEQRETARLAPRMGLYDVPRRATIGYLASELGVSRQAVSGRLRRPHKRLVGRSVG